MELTKAQWKEGLLDVCSFLRVEMISFLEDEGRYFGRVKSYMNNLRDAFSGFERDTTEEEIDIYGRVLGTIRSTIYKEFKRLGQRRLSTADRVIVIMRKILELAAEIDTDPDFRYDREIATCKKVIDKLFDNICLRGKNDALYLLTNLIQSSVASGKYCKFTCDVLDLYHIEHPRPKVMTLSGPETLLDSTGSKVEDSKEITL